MAMTTIGASHASRGDPSSIRPALRSVGAYEAARLTLIAIATVLIGAMTPAVLMAFMVGALTGSWDAAASVAVLAVPFLVITVPTSAIWLIGAVETGRATRRLHGHE